MRDISNEFLRFQPFKGVFLHMSRSKQVKKELIDLLIGITVTMKKNIYWCKKNSF